jgi:RNA polymerase sigma-70 factor (ECF subfamily)
MRERAAGFSTTSREVTPAIVERAKRGDREAFSAVIRHYDAGLRALAFRIVGDRDRMDDALQDAYLRAFRALPGFRGSSSLGTWLYRIVYNASLDELERSRRVVQFPLEHVEAADPSPGRRTPSCSAGISPRRSLCRHPPANTSRRIVDVGDW